MNEENEKDVIFDFQKNTTQAECSRRFCLNGPLITRSDSSTATKKMRDDLLAAESARFFVRESLRDGFLPINFPPLQPVDSPEVICAMTLPAEIELCRADLCRWLTMYRFSGLQSEEIKKIWGKISENYYEGWWKEIPIPDNFFHYAVKNGKTDRFCWRELREETGQTFVEILALSGDPGLKTICSFFSSFKIFGDFSDNPGSPILGVSIRRPAGGNNLAFLRDEKMINL